MKVEFTYTVKVTVDEDKGVLVEQALSDAAKAFDSQFDVEETDACELED